MDIIHWMQLVPFDLRGVFKAFSLRLIWPYYLGQSAMRPNIRAFCFTLYCQCNMASIFIYYFYYYFCINMGSIMSFSVEVHVSYMTCSTDLHPCIVTSDLKRVKMVFHCWNKNTNKKTIHWQDNWVVWTVICIYWYTSRFHLLGFAEKSIPTNNWLRPYQLINPFWQLHQDCHRPCST